MQAWLDVMLLHLHECCVCGVGISERQDVFSCGLSPYLYIRDLNEWIVHSDSAVDSQSYMTTLEQMGRIKGTFLCET